MTTADNLKAAPSFTTVTARTNFGPDTTLLPPPPLPQSSPPLLLPQPQPPKASKKIDWPQSVRDYVQRCVAESAMIPGIGRHETDLRLRAVITAATEDGKLYVINWAAMPLPQEMIQKERETAAAHADKKRKIDQRGPEDGSDTSPPWRKTAKATPFQDRISYASQTQADRVDKSARKRQEVNRIKHESKSSADLERRRQRFESTKPSNNSTPRRSQSPQLDATSGPIVGTNPEIEKRYFRLTAPPKPETVRPLAVLERTLEHLKKKWKLENNYTYICDQFKSLRQDLTVQHIKNEFTVNVYEIHARIALEKGDLGEYNQCQTQLRPLYKQGLSGHPEEFLAYRILYFIHTCNRIEMSDVVANLTPADKKWPAVEHALNVRSALALGNYHRFFRLYLDTPNMGGYLMDMFVGRERLAALANICRA